MEPTPPDIAGFRCIAVLGTGGNSTVWLAQTDAGDEVAVKVIDHPDASQKARLRRESEIPGRLVHDGIVQVLAAAPTETPAWVAMERVDGPTLAEVLKERGRLPLPVVVHLGRGLCEILAALHAVGIAHRDLKPSNLLLADREPWEPRLTDFGLSSDIGEPAEQGEAFHGSPMFVSPEQIRGDAVGPETDLYALGVLLYRSLTGRWPYAITGVGTAMAAHLNSPAIPVAERAPDLDVPEGMTELLDRLLDKDAARRPSAEDALERLLAVPLPEPEPASWPPFWWLIPVGMALGIGLWFLS